MADSFKREIRNAFDEVRAGNSSLFDVFHYFLLSQYGVPDLFVHWPKAVQRTLALLFKRTLSPIYAFSSFDLWLRSYYSKLVRNFREVGRWGFVWDESLGFSMGPRFGSNLLTYTLYGALSPRAFSTFSLGLFLVTAGITGIHSSHGYLTSAVILMLAASPAILFSLVGYGVKPEVVWWALAVPALYSAQIHHWSTVYILLSLLLLVNTSVSVILAILISPLWLWSFISGQLSFGLDLLWLGPGLLIRAWRFWSAYRDGNLGATVREQHTTRQRSDREARSARDMQAVFRIFLGYIPPALKLIVLCSLAGWGTDWPSILALSIGLIGFNSLNWYGLKIADSVTVQIAWLTVILALVLFAGEWIGLLSLFVILYKKPFEVAWYVSGRSNFENLNQEVENCHTIREKLDVYKNLAGGYPWLQRRPYPRPDKLMRFFSRIQDGSRVLMEAGGNPREGGGLTRFHDWTYEFLPDRQIEFVNHTFLNRMLEPGLTEKYLLHFGAPHLTPGRMREICSKLGVSYILVMSEETLEALKSAGYVSLDMVHYEDFSDLADTLFMQRTNLTLLANPEPATPISPSTRLNRIGNKVSWEAKAGQVYELKYRYHPWFTARQAQTDLAIKPYTVFDDLPLQFMRIQAKSDSLLELRYAPKF